MKREPEEAMDDVRGVAAGWFALQRSGEMTAADRQALRAWLDEDAGHRTAYLSVRRAWGGAALLRGHPQVLEIRHGWADRQRRERMMRLAAACLLAVVVTGAGALGWRTVLGPRPLADQSFQTAVGQHSTIELPDGSELILNTDTVVRTRADKERRLVYLERGQAFFRVAKDRNHPFVVTAAGQTVTALGTAFDVRVDAGAFTVTLVEGKVRVEAPLQPAGAGAAVSVKATEMAAGTQLVSAAHDQWRVTPANVVVETSWTKNILIFDNEPLTAVLAELNRYSEKKIVLTDAAIGPTPISGTFRPGDVDSFVRTLEAYRLARRGGNTAEAVQLQAY